MSTCYKYATMWIHLENEEEKERVKEIEERRRRRLARMRENNQWQGPNGSHPMNEEFFSSWQSRTKRGGAANDQTSSGTSSKNFDFNFGDADQAGGQSGTMDFHGRDVHICVNLSF